MLKSSNETVVTLFYHKKEKTTGATKAQVGAARKLVCIVWTVLTCNKPYAEESDDLTARKTIEMSRDPEKAAAFSAEQLSSVIEILWHQIGIIRQINGRSRK